jgi:Mrp family chromosome partitioning ATPase
MRRALDEARALADVVILDTAPLLAEGDVANLLPAVDGVLVVARAGKTTHQMAGRAHEFLDRLAAPVLGVVLTRAEESAVPRRYYGYHLPEEPEAARPGDGAEASPDASEAAPVGDFPDSRDTGRGTTVEHGGLSCLIEPTA